MISLSKVFSAYILLLSVVMGSTAQCNLGTQSISLTVGQSYSIDFKTQLTARGCSCTSTLDSYGNSTLTKNSECAYTFVTNNQADVSTTGELKFRLNFEVGDIKSFNFA